MSFGDSRIYPFPAVQYIPLSISTTMEGAIAKSNPKRNTAQIIAGPELISIQKGLENDYGVIIPDTYSPQVLPILALNLKVTDVKYRSFFVTMLANPQPNYYQLFSIPTNRLYKQKLYFNAFDAVSGKLLANYSLFVSPKAASKNINPLKSFDTRQRLPPQLFPR